MDLCAQIYGILSAGSDLLDHCIMDVHYRYKYSLCIILVCFWLNLNSYLFGLLDLIFRISFVCFLWILMVVE